MDDTCRGCLDVSGPVLRSLWPRRRLIRGDGEKGVVGRRAAFLGEPSRSPKLGLRLELCLRLRLGQGLRLQRRLQRIRRLLLGFWGDVLDDRFLDLRGSWSRGLLGVYDDRLWMWVCILRTGVIVKHMGVLLLQLLMLHLLLNLELLLLLLLLLLYLLLLLLMLYLLLLLLLLL